MRLFAHASKLRMKYAFMPGPDHMHEDLPRIMSQTAHCKIALQAASGDTSAIPWNFAKFLVKKDGTVFGR